MRKVLKSREEVCHYWANAVQSEGKAGNIFFEDGVIYSYGRHFAMARILPSGVVVMTTRGYSSSTAQHLAKVRSAASHREFVYCNDPKDSALQNKEQAAQSIKSALDDAEKPRIRQATRDGHKAQALRIAERFNAYLFALPEAERENVSRFDTTGLQHIRAVMLQNEAEAKARREAAAIERNREAVVKLQEWATGGDVHGYSFHTLPVALRLAYREGYKTEPGYQTIETSHGAEIPVSFASRLWALIEATRQSGRAFENINRPCGVYTLNTIRADGSIVVGCHDIPYSEIRKIAVVLGYVESTEQVSA